MKADESADCAVLCLDTNAFMKTQPLEELGWGVLLVRVGAARSLRIAFGGCIARVSAPRPTPQQVHVHMFYGPSALSV
jgi:hypothetical protein